MGFFSELDQLQVNLSCNLSFTLSVNLVNEISNTCLSGSDCKVCKTLACTLFGGALVIIVLLVLLLVMTLTVCCLVARLLRARKRRCLVSKRKNSTCADNEETNAQDSFPLTTLTPKENPGTNEDNQIPEHNLSPPSTTPTAQPTPDNSNNVQKKPENEPKDSFKITEQDGEGESGSNAVPHYTEVVKVKKKKKRSKLPTKVYNKLKRNSEPTSSHLSSANTPQSPTEADEHSYSPLGTADLPPPIPPPFCEDTLMPVATGGQGREGQVESGAREGDTGEAVYYNEPAASKPEDIDEASSPAEKMTEEKVQYANC